MISFQGPPVYFVTHLWNNITRQAHTAQQMTGAIVSNSCIMTGVVMINQLLRGRYVLFNRLLGENA
jgi:hypothetical protein